MQENGSMVARGSTMMPIAAGKGVGGSTLINSALSFVAPDEVLNGGLPYSTMILGPLTICVQPMMKFLPQLELPLQILLWLETTT